MSTPSFAFVGFGELGSMLAHGLRRRGVVDLRVWSRPHPSLSERVVLAGARLCGSLPEAVAAAEVVIAAVPAGSATAVCAECAPHLHAGAIYVDPAPLPPELKADAAAAIGGTGALYVDVAVLGTAAADGFDVTFLSAGPGAESWQALAAPLGLNVSVLGGEPGSATRVKLLRSVYMKGRDALIVEMLIAGHNLGLERELIESIDCAGERVPFPDLAKRVVTALAIHAERRADELAASADVLRQAGVEPLMAEAGEERLRRVAELGLREHFAGERPERIDEVLDLIAVGELPAPISR